MPLCLEISRNVIWFTEHIFPMGLCSSEQSLGNAEIEEVFSIMLPGNENEEYENRGLI